MYKLAKHLDIAEGDKGFLLVPVNATHLGGPERPFQGLHIKHQTLYMQKTEGTNYEIFALSYDPTLDTYILKPLKGGSGSLYGIVVSPDGSAIGVKVAADGKVGIGKSPTTSPLEVQGNTDIAGQILCSPTSAAAPFVLNANAQNQLVSKLNADLLDGTEKADLAGAIIDISNTVGTITGTTSEQDLYTMTVPANLLTSCKVLEMVVMFYGSVGSGDVLRVKFGGQTYFTSSSSLSSDGYNLLRVFLSLQSGSTTQVRGIGILNSEVVFGSFDSSRFGDGDLKTVDITSNQTLRATIQPNNTADSFTKIMGFVRRVS